MLGPDIWTCLLLTKLSFNCFLPVEGRARTFNQTHTHTYSHTALIWVPSVNMCTSPPLSFNRSPPGNAADQGAAHAQVRVQSQLSRVPAEAFVITSVRLLLTPPARPLFFCALAAPNLLICLPVKL
jgi:hypothetical protein